MRLIKALLAAGFVYVVSKQAHAATYTFDNNEFKFYTTTQHAETIQVKHYNPNKSKDSNITMTVYIDGVPNKKQYTTSIDWFNRNEISYLEQNQNAFDGADFITVQDLINQTTFTYQFGGEYTAPVPEASSIMLTLFAVFILVTRRNKKK